MKARQGGKWYGVAIHFEIELGKTNGLRTARLETKSRSRLAQGQEVQQEAEEMVDGERKGGRCWRD